MLAADLGVFTFSSVSVALAIVLGGLAWQVYDELRQSPTDPASVKAIVFGMLMFFFLLLALTLGVFSLPNVPPEGTLVSPALQEELAKAAQQYLLRAQVVLLAILGLMVPMIFGLWNTFCRDYLDELRRLASVPIGSSSAEQQAALQAAKAEYLAIQGFGAWLQPPFYALVFFMVLVLLLSAIPMGNVSGTLAQAAPLGVKTVFVLAATAKYLAELCVLLALFLLLTYMLLVQRSLTKLHSVAASRL